MLAIGGHSGAWSDRGGRAASGLALRVPHGRRAGQAAGLVPGGEPLELVIAVLLSPCDQHHRQR